MRIYLRKMGSVALLSREGEVVIAKEIERTDRDNLPVNLIYPPNYPEEPAIMLNELVVPDDVQRRLH